MATTALTLGNELLSSTMYVLMKEWKSTLHESTRFLDAHARVHGEGGPTQDGGTRIVCAVGVGEHSSPTRMQTGFERIDLTVGDVFAPAVYSWAHVIRPVAISSEEEFINSGESAVLSILEGRTQMVADAMKRNFVQQMVAGNVTGWEDWNTLNGIDASDQANGFLEPSAVDGQSHSVGGLSKSTYAGGWNNRVYDGSGSFNSNGLAGLYDLMVEIKAVSPSGPPNVILASRSAFKNLKRALQAHERYVTQDKIDGGRLVQLWDGVQIDVEYNMPNGGTESGAAGDPEASFYFLNMNDVYVTWDPKGFFELSDFETVSGEYDVRAAKMRCRGQLCARHLGSSGLAYGLDTF